jgi:predicted transcriptional regulator
MQDAMAQKRTLRQQHIASVKERLKKYLAEEDLTRAELAGMLGVGQYLLARLVKEVEAGQ